MKIIYLYLLFFNLIHYKTNDESSALQNGIQLIFTKCANLIIYGLQPENLIKIIVIILEIIIIFKVYSCLSNNRNQKVLNFLNELNYQHEEDKKKFQQIYQHYKPETNLYSNLLSQQISLKLLKLKTQNNIDTSLISN